MIDSQILRIVGPTASGKTALATQLAQKLLKKNIFKEIIYVNVDSRQVYADLSILSGVDLDEFKEFDLIKKENYWQSQNHNFKVYNLACYNFSNIFSLGKFLNLIENLIKEIKKKDVLIIFVGGSFLYQQRIFENYDKVVIPPNQKLREKLETLPLFQLQNLLLVKDNDKFFSLQESDLKNKRRLIRYLEIRDYKNKKNNINERKKRNLLAEYKKTTIILNASNRFLKSKLNLRMEKRLKQNVVTEVDLFCQKYQEKKLENLPLGFEEIVSFLKNKKSFLQMKAIWLKKEIEFLRKQKLWLSREKGFKFDIENEDWLDKAIEFMINFYEYGEIKS